MRIIFFILLLFHFHSLCLFSQNIDSVYCVDFIKKNEIRDNKPVQAMIGPQKMIIDTLLRGKPLGFYYNAVFSVTINPFQEKYERYINETISKDSFLSYIEIFNVDTTKLSRISLCENHFYVFVGINEEKKKKVIIVDCNNNHDFSDDSVFVFNMNDYGLGAYSEAQTQLFPRFQVNVTYFNGIECITTKTSLRINPFDSFYEKEKYISENEYFLNFVILTDFYFEGKINIGNKKVNIYGNESYPILVSEKLNQNYEFRFFEENKNTAYINSHTIGDTILIAGKKIYIQGVKGKILYLKDLGNYIDRSRIGELFPDVYAYSLENSQKIQLNSLMKDKYVFIDFWGSWCNPCIESLPKIKNLYNEIKNRDDVMILGVALEKPQDISKLKTIIIENKIEWLNIWSNFSARKSLTSIHGLLGIEIFPTYIIVDKDGRIVYNTYINSIDSPIVFFNKLINNNK